MAGFGAHRGSNEKTAQAVIEEQGLVQMGDTGEVYSLIDGVIAAIRSQYPVMGPQRSVVGSFLGQG